MIAAFFIGEGGFNPLKATMRESLLMVAFVITCAGLLLAWRFELTGALMTIGGMMLFYLIEFIATGRLLMGWAFPLIALPGLLHLFCVWQERIQSHQAGK
jgi:hypothetical protein